MSTTPETLCPRSGYDTVGGLLYFPRMLDKIRLHAAGRLRADFHANLGIGGDGFCCGFLHIDYAKLRARVLEGGTDEDILRWCFETGRVLNDMDLLVWSHFVKKLGWNDMVTPGLERYKAASGLAQRKEIVTIAEYWEVDEGRKS